MRRTCTRLAAIAAISAALLGLWQAPAYAMQSQISSGDASSQHWYEVRFDTLRDGDVTVRATWTPDPKRLYVLHLKRLTDPSDTLSYDRLCTQYTGKTGAPPPGDWTCTIPNGAAGHYYAAFRPTTGKAFVTLATTAETD